MKTNHRLIGMSLMLAALVPGSAVGEDAPSTDQDRGVLVYEWDGGGSNVYMGTMRTQLSHFLSGSSSRSLTPLRDATEDATERSPSGTLARTTTGVGGTGQEAGGGEQGAQWVKGQFKIGFDGRNQELAFPNSWSGGVSIVNWSTVVEPRALFVRGKAIGGAERSGFVEVSLMGDVVAYESYDANAPQKTVHYSAGAGALQAERTAHYQGYMGVHTYVVALTRSISASGSVKASSAQDPVISAEFEASASGIGATEQSFFLSFGLIPHSHVSLLPVDQIRWQMGATASAGELDGSSSIEVPQLTASTMVEESNEFVDWLLGLFSDGDSDTDEEEDSGSVWDSVDFDVQQTFQPRSSSITLR